MDQDVIRARFETAILEALDAIGEQPAAWGRDDCALWVADIVAKATGRDPAAAWRGRYNDRAGAARLLGPLGLGFALRRAARACGWRHIAGSEADTGDIGLAMIPAVDDVGNIVRRPLTMICRVRGWFVARSEDGFVALDSAAIKSAWAAA
ncbi:MAG: hypothetical protein EPO23_03230 [Xanthobacteraceae bacterium]|nr:MAG: hypothetical protein EPO23_03230 [Xanthobacteraceae bacterium]